MNPRINNWYPGVKVFNEIFIDETLLRLKRVRPFILDLVRVILLLTTKDHGLLLYFNVDDLGPMVLDLLRLVASLGVVPILNHLLI